MKISVKRSSDIKTWAQRSDDMSPNQIEGKKRAVRVKPFHPSYEYGRGQL